MMADLTGQQFGNYRLIRRLGSGGFASVYLGQHVRVASQQAAVKILHLFDVDIQTFQQEAETTAVLIHPHIVRLFDFDLHQGIPFLVMDYAPHGTLRNRHMKGTQLPLVTIVQYIKEIAPALQYAHDRNIIHRDVKPENMLIGLHNELLLSDFGIALLSKTGRTSLQHYNNIGGTAEYMAPEMFSGKPEKASDQYSLGIVVYEWLCGTPPFSEGNFIQLGYQHNHIPTPLIQEKLPTISPSIEAVVMRALAKDPQHRYTSVQAFANALEQANKPEQLTFVKPQSVQGATKPIPPLPSAHLMRSSPFPQQKAKTSVNDSIPAKIKPIKRPSSGKIFPSNSQKVNIWRIGKRQIVAIVLNSLLFIGLSPLAGWFDGNNPSIIGIVLLVLFEASTLFFGVVFGPWVGFFIGGIDSLISGYIFSCFFNITRGLDFSYTTKLFISGFIQGWPFTLAIAFIGFIAGLAVLKTKGHYNNLRAIAFAEGLSSLGIVFMLSITMLVEARGSFYIFINNFLYYLVFSLPGMVLLPIMLFIYGKVAAHRGDVV